MDDMNEDDDANEAFLLDILDDPLNIFNLNLDVNGNGNVLDILSRLQESS